jgi:hypothetical protein
MAKDLSMKESIAASTVGVRILPPNNFSPQMRAAKKATTASPHYSDPGVKQLVRNPLLSPPTPHSTKIAFKVKTNIQLTHTFDFAYHL